MISATLAVMAFAGLFGPSNAGQIKWHSDYRSAQKLAVEQHKPLAVFIAKGSSDLLRKIPTDVAQVLRTDYVAVVVDSDDAEGKKLAAAFELTVGVIVSDRTGEKQALRIEGTLSPGDFSRTLERLANPDRVATTTEVQGTTVALPPPLRTYVPAAPAAVCRT